MLRAKKPRQLCRTKCKNLPRRDKDLPLGHTMQHVRTRATANSKGTCRIFSKYHLYFYSEEITRFTGEPCTTEPPLAGPWLITLPAAIVLLLC
jgi:hypothetical protein